jgi:hypothetical protein
MDERPYFYRVRGRTLGPVGLRQIRQLAQRAQIGRTTDVSRDGMQWGKASDCPEIFDAGGGGQGPPTDAGGIGLGPPIDIGDSGLGPPFGEPPMVTASQWYYAINGVQKGPVALTVLQQMVSSGQLKPDDQVFVEGSADWTAVSKVPQLSGGQWATGGGMPVINAVNHNPQSAGPNGFAIAGFVLSLLSLPLGCLCGVFSLPLSILGLIFSGVAMAGRNQSQRGLAIAGLVISISSMVIAIVVMVIGIAINLPKF